MVKVPKYNHRDLDYEEEAHYEEEPQSEDEMSESEGRLFDDETSESGDNTSDCENEDEDSVWGPIKEEAKERHREQYEELVQSFFD